MSGGDLPCTMPLSAFAFTAETGKTVDAYYGDLYVGSDGDYYHSPESYQVIRYDSSGARQILCIESGVEYGAYQSYTSKSGKNSAYFQNLPYIPMQNLKWFAAFHNESHHPHVHLIAYSTKQSEGYLSKDGVNNLRSSFAKDIFAQDLISVYEKQTEHRDDLKMQSKDIMSEIVSQINRGIYDNPKLESMLTELADRLSKTSGKKVYGYLKADVKDLIDRIVDELAADERIVTLYDLWYEQRENVIRTYTEALSKRVPLSQNKEFKSVRNMIITEAMNLILQNDMDDLPDEQTPIEDDANSPAWQKRNIFLSLGN